MPIPGIRRRMRLHDNLRMELIRMELTIMNSLQVPAGHIHGQHPRLAKNPGYRVEDVYKRTDRIQFTNLLSPINLSNALHCCSIMNLCP